MLRGLCVVLDSWTTGDNPYRRPGVQLGLRSLTVESKPVFQRLLDVGAAAREIEDQSRPTLVRTPPFPTPATVERTQGSACVLPANPLMEMTDESLQDFVECTMFEATGSVPVAEERDEPVTRRLRAMTHPMQTVAPERADFPFAQVLQAASERLQPVPTPTMLGLAPVSAPAPRARVAMPAIEDPSAPSATLAPAPAPRPTPGFSTAPSWGWIRGYLRSGACWHLAAALRAWYRKLVWNARRWWDARHQGAS
jgi:hypothetical protein